MGSGVRKGPGEGDQRGDINGAESTLVSVTGEVSLMSVLGSVTFLINVDDIDYALKPSPTISKWCNALRASEDRRAGVVK